MSGEAQRQLASSGVAHHDYLRGVQFGALGDLGDVAVTVADILEGARPAAARVAHTAILHVPGRESFGSESGAEVSGVIQIVFGTPEATVNVHDYGERATGFWNPQFGELIWIGSVGQASVRRGRGQGQNIVIGHGLELGSRWRRLDASGWMY